MLNNRNYFHLLHGVVKGDAIYNKKIESQRFKVSLAGYIEKYGPIDGPIKCNANKDHASLLYYTNTHGSEQGLEKYTQNCARLVAVLTNRTSISKWCQDICEEIKQEITDLFYYGENELIFAVKDFPRLRQKIVRPDLFYRGKIIEFQGDVFHANPLLYESNDTPHPFNRAITSSEIWDIDKARLDYYKTKQYNALEVWELEWKNNKEETIAKCVNFLKKHSNGTK